MPLSLRSGASERYQRGMGGLALVGIIFAFAALFGRVVYINSALGARLLDIASAQYQGNLTIPAQRGAVYDVKGRLLVGSRLVPDVFVDPSLVEDVESLAQELAPQLGLSKEDIANTIRGREGSRFVLIASGVDDVTADEVRRFNHPGVGITHHFVRHYPQGRLMAHVLGFVGADGNGLSGIELGQDGHLKGRDGGREMLRDARRRALLAVPDGATPPVDGGDVILTLDVEVQRFAEEAIEQAAKKFHAESAVAIVMRLRTGEILSMACYPTFDPRAFTEVDAEFLRNRSITDPVEPGSTFKPFVVAGALAGHFTTTTEIFDTGDGTRSFGPRVIRDTHPHGRLNIEGILAHSSNVGMAMIGERMGNTALHSTAAAFGVGQRTGIDCPGEGTGLLREVKKWTRLSAASVAIGYEVAVTPIQLLTAFASIANDGELLQPHLVRSLLAPDGSVGKSFDEPIYVRRSTSIDVARYLRTGPLVSVMEEGTGAKVPSRFHLIGKTGTPKLAYRNRGGYEPGAYMGIFVGAGPAENPEIAAVVMVRRPDAKIGYYGSTIAAPACVTILDQTLAYLGHEPPCRDEAIELTQVARR